MTPRKAISWGLLVLFAGLSFYVFVRPVLRPQAEIIQGAELLAAGKDTTGDPSYIRFEKQAAVIGDLIEKLSPVLVLLLRELFREKKKGG